MYAGHFAAALAIRGIEPKAPVWALTGAAFLPDLLWLGLSIAGIERVGPGPWFDGYSHSVLSISLQAAVLAALYVPRGRGLALAVGGAVLSHLALDLPMHPDQLQWYPESAAKVGNFLHGWAGEPSLLGKTRGWWTETAVVAALLAVYASLRERARIGSATAAASIVLVASLQIALG